jgi:hypothetical protein
VTDQPPKPRSRRAPQATPRKRSTGATRRTVEEPSAAAPGVEAERRPAPDTPDARGPSGPEETHNERVTTPVGADRHGGDQAAATHGTTPAHDAHGAPAAHAVPHGDGHAAGEHAVESHGLGPIDVRAWGAAVLGLAVGLLVAWMFYLAIT